MAITVTVNPVIPSGDGGYELLARSIMAGQEIKRKREEEIQKAILAQRDANQKVFGSTQENLRTFYKDAANVPAEVKNSIFNQGLQELKAAANTPEFQTKAQEIANRAFQSNNTYSSFYKGVADASKVLSDEMGMDQATILSFANKSLFEEQKDMQGNVIGRRLRDISNIADPIDFIRNEVMAHPEVYINRTAMDTGAFKEMDDMRKKDANIKSDLKTDPTGKKALSLGYNYKLSPFESEEERTDNVTGLKYKVPVLKEVVSTIPIPGSKDSYKELDPVKYEQFVGQAGPMTKKKLYIGAIDYIRDHNARALATAGVQNASDVALTISKNNVNMFEKVPGFVNPFNTANIESFERIYAKDFLRLAKQYDEKGEAKEFTLNRGVDVAKPPITVNINEKSATGAESKPYHPTTIVQGIIENRGGFRGAPVKIKEATDAVDVTDAFTSYKLAGIGQFKQPYKRIYFSPQKNRFYYSSSPEGNLTGQSPDQFQSAILQAAPDLGFNADAKIFRKLPPATQPTKTITSEEFKKMTVTERARFRSEGGEVRD